MNAAEKAFAAAFAELKEQLRAELREELLTDLQQSYQDSRLTIEEAADHLNVSKETIQRMCKQKLLPHIPIGVEGSRKPRILFSLSSLDAWIRKKERESVAQ